MASSPEQRRERYRNMNPEMKADLLLRNQLRYDSPDRPDTKTPRWVTDEIRIRVLAAGGDPGLTCDVTIHAAALALENEELGRSYLCGDYFPKFCGVTSYNWRRCVSEKTKERLRALAADRNKQVNSSQFASEQP